MKKEKFRCEFCGGPVVFVAAQSVDAGKTVTWHLICSDHRDGWNEGGDWVAPIFKIGEREE